MLSSTQEESDLTPLELSLQTGNWQLHTQPRLRTKNEYSSQLIWAEQLSG